MQSRHHLGYLLGLTTWLVLTTGCGKEGELSTRPRPSEVVVNVRRTVGERSKGIQIGADPSFRVNYDLVISEGSQETVVASEVRSESKINAHWQPPMRLHATLVQRREVWVLVTQQWDLNVMRFVRGAKPGVWTLAASERLRGSVSWDRPLTTELVELDGTVTAAMDYGTKGKYEARLAVTAQGIDVEVLSQPM
ncbi:MAG: hypothetical protein O7H41_08040 [Planctomycetota bacterium]|nr:hypothetical protein [Planctomycetota bacterium]